MIRIGRADRSGGGVVAVRAASPVYRLVYAPPPPTVPPVLDAGQRAVVEHRGGPLLVLAGPGTGKTTTLVEAVAHRVAAGTDPARILALTFSRRAAAELRDRIGGRLGRTTLTPTASTFHAFCHALLTGPDRPGDGRPLRMLCGAEQQVAVGELLAGTVSDPLTRISWPDQIAAAVGTRGLTEEVRDVLARVDERGLDLRRLAALEPGKGEQWRALARFAEVYSDVLDARGMVDNARLIRAAVDELAHPVARMRMRARFDAVFVDEYQDADPAQVELLAALAGDGRDLVVFGDPDQSIYAFRGADVRGILEFPTRFRTVTGAAAPVLALTVSRRATPGLLAAARQVARRLPLRGLDASAVRAHRELGGAGAVAVPGPDLEVATFPSRGAELGHVGDMLRRAHLEEGLAWSDMAVLVRAGVRTIPVVRRVLSSLEIPLSLAAEEVPLAAEPTVAMLLTALQFAVDPTAVTAGMARALLGSPLCGLEPEQLRLFGRAERARARAADAGPVASSAELIRLALLDPVGPTGELDDAAASVRRIGELLAGAAARVAAGAAVGEVLWHLWSGTSWPERLERAAAGRGPAAQRAEHALDAVCALFAAAERTDDAQPGGGGVRAFVAAIAAQQIPGEPPAAGNRNGEAVALMTAHRAKGLEWPLVAIVGVQEGVWPDLRRRGGLLSADRLGPDGPGPAPTTGELLAEERRLFYVAVTRARRRLLVTAVDDPAEDGERPSRFLGELGVRPRGVPARPNRTLSVAGLVGELRAVLFDEQASPALREAAAARLAALAAARGADGRALAPAARPENWWGCAEPTSAVTPVRDPALPLALSGSAVQTLADCPLRWFLRREVHAEDAPGVAQAFGTVLHALAEEVGRGVPADVDALPGRLDAVWDELSFEARWQGPQQREAAAAALVRFLAWHTGRPDRTLVGVEVPVDVTVDADGEAVRIRGRLDRVELDARGAVHIVDLKTSRTPVAVAAVAEHPQLGIYQLAVTAGALAEVVGPEAELGGAELVMLRQEEAGTGMPRIHVQEPVGRGADPQRFARLLGESARRVRAERFSPNPSDECDRCEFRGCCSARPEGRGLVS